MNGNNNLSLEDIDSDAMHDINDIIANFKHFGFGLSFQEEIDFFNEAGIISRDRVDAYIKSNIEKIQEIYLKTGLDMIVEDVEKSQKEKQSKEYKRKFTISNLKKLLKNDEVKEDWDAQVKQKIREQQEQDSSKISVLTDKVIETRDVDYNYFSEYVSRLKQKGLTYLSIFQFVGNNNQPQLDNQYWENLLSKLDITVNGTSMYGEDIKRILVALFNSQIEITKKMNVGNDVKTYESPYLSEYARIGAKYGSNEMYPDDDIISKLGAMDFPEMIDCTSIAMSKRQLKEKQIEEEKEKEEFFKSSIFKHIMEMK